MRPYLLFSLIFAGCVAAPNGICGEPDPPAAHGDATWGMLKQYCDDCHNATDWAGGVAFDTMTADGVAARTIDAATGQAPA
jgi:hypothetical protein